MRSQHALALTYQAIWAVLQAEATLCADETPWAVLSNGHTANGRFYAWCAVGERYEGYRLLDIRSAEGAATILGSFAGTLMVDGLTSCPAAAKGKPGEPPKFIVGNCHAHARRKFVECEKHWPAESEHAIELYKQLYAVEREGSKRSAAREGREPGADLLALRQEKSKPLLDELSGSRSRRGTETAAILYTLVESAKRVGGSPMAYLEAAADHSLRQAGAVLLPDEFKGQLDAAKAALEAAKADPPPADTA